MAEEADIEGFKAATREQLAEYRRILEDHIQRNQLGSLSNPAYLRTLPAGDDPYFVAYMTSVSAKLPEPAKIAENKAFRDQILNELDAHILKDKSDRYASPTNTALPPGHGGTEAAKATEETRKGIFGAIGGVVGSFFSNIGGFLGPIIGNIAQALPAMLFGKQLGRLADRMQFGPDKMGEVIEIRDAWAASSGAAFSKVYTYEGKKYSFSFNPTMEAGDREIHASYIRDAVASRRGGRAGGSAVSGNTGGSGGGIQPGADAGGLHPGAAVPQGAADRMAELARLPAPPEPEPTDPSDVRVQRTPPAQPVVAGITPGP